MCLEGTRFYHVALLVSSIDLHYDVSMKIRTQVQFEEGQYNALKRMAQESGISLSAVLRQIVQERLRAPEDENPRWNLAWELVGIGQDREGATDLAGNHDDYAWDS